MNILSRTITGISMFCVGAGLLVPSFLVSFFFLIYSIPLLILGIFILFNKKEDYIEQIKSKGGK